MSALCQEVERAFAGRSRWDTISFSDEDTRSKLADFNDETAQIILSKYPDKNYIDYLKCYIEVWNDPYFCEDVPNEYEFIKQKCEEFGFLDEFKKYYRG